jgi:hypothetical protein
MKKKGPSFNSKYALKQIMAPYPYKVQVNMKANIFNSLQFIDYFVVYVGQSDCGKNIIHSFHSFGFSY